MTDEKKPGDEVIEDMSLDKDTDEEKKEKQKEAEKKVTPGPDFTLSDMTLDETSALSALEIGVKLAKTFQGVDLVDTGKLKVMKMMDGSYTVEGTKLADLKPEDLAEIGRFIKSEEAKE